VLFRNLGWALITFAALAPMVSGPAWINKPAEDPPAEREEPSH